jgi:deoxyribodipyrimidine photo-lyase
LEDNRGLQAALESGLPIIPLFIFDKNILDRLDRKADARLKFIRDTLDDLNAELRRFKSAFIIYHTDPVSAFNQLIKTYNIQKVFCNRDYEPLATERDKKIELFLRQNQIEFHQFKDQVLFERDEIVKDDGDPYKVFTPFSRKWKNQLQQDPGILHECKPQLNRLAELTASIPGLQSLGFEKSAIDIPRLSLNRNRLKDYDKNRNFPAVEGTSRLGVHLRFGTISIRKLVRFALKTNPTFLNQLIWREFFMQILYHFPGSATESFRPAYRNLPWRFDEKEFERWKTGTTGFPMIDAGIRELIHTGYMHNRVRMVTASFLCKHLLMDWRIGEAFFARHLLDYEQASNVGSWQWAASTGCDSVPYFRIFNPHTQLKKFDPEYKYVSKWIPELNGFEYPEPMIDHKFARERCLRFFKDHLDRN